MLNLNIAGEAAQKAAAIQIELCKVRMGGARAYQPVGADAKSGCGAEGGKTATPP